MLTPPKMPEPLPDTSLGVAAGDEPAELERLRADLADLRDHVLQSDFEIDDLRLKTAEARLPWYRNIQSLVAVLALLLSLSTTVVSGYWARTQGDLFGDAMEVTDGYRSWWSYIPHFIGTPGYVYAYAYGQLLALSVYARYVERGDEFVPKYLELLSAGGSRWPEELGRIVDCDLTDPGFWDAGLAIIDTKLTEAEQAAADAGRL